MINVPVRHLATARTSLRLSEEFDIRDIGHVLNGADLTQPLHRHDHYFLLVIQEGEGTHECDLRQHRIRARSIYSMRPGQVHRLELKAGSAGHILQFKADFLATYGSPIRQVLRRAGYLEAFHPGPERATDLWTAVERIARECALPDPQLPIVRAYLNAFLTDLVHRSPLPDAAKGTDNYALERLVELQELIETRVHRTKEVGTYAQLMHLSAYQLNAICKAGTGRTCSQLINDQIILEAKRYLLATSDQVGQVADLLGYEDVSYFIRFFKRHTGHTPEGFRQRSR